MKAVVIEKYGSPDVLSIRNVAMPSLSDGKVLVETRCTSVNPIDCKIRSGAFRLLFGGKLPKILGADFSGIVIESNNPEFKINDRVFGMLDYRNGGCYVEYISAPVSNISQMPKNIGFEQAAVIPLVALTAFQALIRLGNIQSGSKVLINGASGGVGSVAVQIAKHYNARITAVCSKTNKDYVTSLGALNVLDYSNPNFLVGSGKFDIIFDVIGNLKMSQFDSHLEKNGIYISLKPTPIKFLQAFLFKRIKLLFVKPSKEELEIIKTLIECGSLKAIIEKTYDIEDICKAHIHSETGSIKGKICIKIK
jgi:NADPH:quinone reductase-like Zn-dependent oxidoreductase